ncbi:hypothetical protein ACW9IH_16500 [Pseudomonas gingeri]
MNDELNARFWPILLKKSIRPDCPHTDRKNAAFARRHAKSEPGILCSK